MFRAFPKPKILNLISLRLYMFFAGFLRSRRASEKLLSPTVVHEPVDPPSPGLDNMQRL